MYYAGIGIIALIVLTIINIEAFRKVEKNKRKQFTPQIPPISAHVGCVFPFGYIVGILL